MFNVFFIANLLLSVTVKEFWRSVRIWQSYGKKIKWHLFPDTVYTLVLRWMSYLSVSGYLRLSCL